MTSTPRVPKAEITGLSGWLLKRLSRKHLGDVPEAASVMWHNRAVLFGSMGFGRKVEKWDQLDRSLKTYAHMAVARCSGAAGASTSTTSRPTTTDSTRPRPAKCHGGGSRPCSRRSSVT